MDFFAGAAIDWDSGGSYEGTKSNMTIELTAGGSNAVSFITLGDIVEFRAASAGTRNTGAGTATALQENQVVARCLVVVVDSATQLDLENLSLAGGDTYDVVDQDPARVVTNAIPEGHGTPTAWSDELVHVWGSTQIMKTPMSLTGSLANAKLRGYNNERARIRDEKAKEHKLKLERMYLMGYCMRASASSRATMPTAFVNPTTTDTSYNNQWRTSWGVIPLLETFGTANYQVFTRNWGSYDVDQFIDDMEARSKYFNEDMTEYAFAGSKVLAELSKTGVNSFFTRSGGALALSQWNMTKLGFAVRTLTHPFGQLHIAWTPVLRGAPYNNHLVIVSARDVNRVVYRAPKFETGLQANDYDGIKEQFFSDEGLGLKLIERHALFKFY